MKATYRVLMAGAFLVPAFLVSSCDDKNSNPVAPSDGPTVGDIEAPSFTVVGFGSKWHDPHINGPDVRTFNQTFANNGCTALAKRFGSKDGAELLSAYLDEANSGVILEDEDHCIAGAYPSSNKIKGKKLGDVKELDFSYAGGSMFGQTADGPTLRVPIDECEVDAVVTPAPSCTDGVQDGYARIEARDCDDGDALVGVANAQDKDPCYWYYFNSTTGAPTEYFTSWDNFVETHPDWRIARTQSDGSEARTSVYLSAYNGDDAHYLVWMLDIR